MKNTTCWYTNKQQGFSFIEIMVVVVIIGIMATAVAGRFFGQTQEAQLTQVRADFKTIETALSVYQLNNFRVPTTEQGLQALVEKPSIDPVPKNWVEGGYLDKIPRDPWGTPYLYNSPGEKGKYDIYSHGADGVAGGTDIDKDLFHWQDF